MPGSVPPKKGGRSVLGRGPCPRRCRDQQRERDTALHGNALLPTEPAAPLCAPPKDRTKADEMRRLHHRAGVITSADRLPSFFAYLAFFWCLTAVNDSHSAHSQGGVTSAIERGSGENS